MADPTVLVTDPTALSQLQQALTALACAAVTTGIGLGMAWLKAHLNISASNSAEASIRTAAATAAGVIAATIAPTAPVNTAPAALVNPGVLAQAAAKVTADLPSEVKLTGYTPKDIEDMILGTLPTILGAVNPALGAAAGAAAGVVKAVQNS